MITRAKSGIFKPKIYTVSSITSEPVNFEQTVTNKHWRTAIDEEYKALIKNKTWDLVSPSKDKNKIGCKWTFKLKKNPDGSVNKYKARLVAKGYS